MSRNDRLAQQIQRELSTLIQMDIKDPRLGMVTVSAVDLSRDLSLAKVFVTVMHVGKTSDADSEKKALEESLKVLERASSFLKKQLGARLILRAVPNLKFYYDESIARGRHLSSLIDDAISKDQLQSDD